MSGYEGVSRYVESGAPVARSLAAVLRDAFSSDDDACRLIAATAGAPYPDPSPERSGYVRAVINGQTLKVPRLRNGAAISPASGSPIYLLATRTALLYIGNVSEDMG
jgi:hypothetical protein